ncbi:MAG TPA: hypothetical protein VFB26_01875 [Gaiellaceae bacterium]|nr:hypothetical protein [Gaiellaceae bacterium]
MATKKQRRRREKEKRHEYEIVYVDHEGNEVDPETIEQPANGRREGAGKARASGRASGAAQRRRGRVPQPPSWRRVAKRGAIFAPLFLATVLLLGGKKVTFAAAVVQTLILVVFFVPFSYFLDAMVWRSFQKRTGGAKR